MGFRDIIKKSFLDNYALMEVDAKKAALTILVSCLLALYIFFAYRFIIKKSFYSKSFNIALAALTVITASVILTIQVSIVVSLGMVGALSIVRFRTAIKDPMDLVFLFWSIAAGIICGVGLYELAVFISLTTTILIIVLDLIPQAKAPQIILVNYENEKELSEKVQSLIKEGSSHCEEKSMTISGGQANEVYELRTANGKEICNKLSGLEGVHSVSMLRHDGEVTY